MSVIRINDFSHSENVTLPDIEETITELFYNHREDYYVDEDDIKGLLEGEEIESGNYGGVEQLFIDLSIQHPTTIFSYIGYSFKDNSYYKVYFKDGKSHSVEGKLVFEDFNINEL